MLWPDLPSLSISSLSRLLSNQCPTCLRWLSLKLSQRCRWACCFPACVPAAPQWVLWPGAANKLCIQTVDATNGAVHWTNTGDEQLKRCGIPPAIEGARPPTLSWASTRITVLSAQKSCCYVVKSHFTPCLHSVLNNVYLRWLYIQIHSFLCANTFTLFENVFNS